MSEHIYEKDDLIAPVVPATDARPDGNLVIDNSGRAIVAMLQKAANMAKEDCAQALEVAHKLSSELRAAEQRVRRAEAEAARLRDRASQAEAWLRRIRDDIEQIFFRR
jgi:hypothetical protein